MISADFTSSRFDEAHWRERCAAAPDGFVPCSAEMARVAAEHAFGRSFTIHAFRAERHFSACLVAPVAGSPVTGGQARGPWALVPDFDRAFGRLMPILWRRQQRTDGHSAWHRVAAFRETAVAISATRPLHLSPCWLGEDGAVDARIVDRVLVADGFMPGQVPGSALGMRVYDWRRG
jgi:hypothetical protein